MVLVQPGLTLAHGVSHGPVKWRTRGQEADDTRRAVGGRPMGLAAHPDGPGSVWLMEAGGMIPSAQLWWHCGARLTPAFPGWIQRLVDARRMLDEIATWLEFRWETLPGAAQPSPAGGTLQRLAWALPAVAAEPLVRAWRQTPADLFPESVTPNDMRLSLKARRALQRSEADLLACEGGQPSPEACAWILRARFEPRARQRPRRCVERMVGILGAYPFLSTALGLIVEPEPEPQITPACAHLLNRAASSILAGDPLPDIQQLAVRAAHAQEGPREAA